MISIFHDITHRLEHNDCQTQLITSMSLLPSVPQVGCMVQWASASHVSLVHIGPIL